MPKLEDLRWKRPDNYAGHEPQGFVVATRHRDSDCMDRARWAAFEKAALEAAGLDKLPWLGRGEVDAPVYGMHARHWAVGWIEHLILKADAPEEVKNAIEDLLEQDEHTVVYDEEFLEECEREAAERYWAELDTRDRVILIKRFNDYTGGNVSLFAARRNTPPPEMSPGDILY